MKANQVSPAYNAYVSSTPLDRETRTHLTTAEAAIHLNRREQTLRGWACFENGPLRPIRIHGRLAWPVSEIKRLMNVVPTGYSGESKGQTQPVNESSNRDNPALDWLAESALSALEQKSAMAPSWIDDKRLYLTGLSRLKVLSWIVNELDPGNFAVVANHLGVTVQELLAVRRVLTKI